MKEINGELKSALVGGGGENKVEMSGRRRRRRRRGGQSLRGCVGILGRRSLRPQLNPHRWLAGAGGPDGGLLLLPGGIYHTVHKSACLTSPAQSLHPKLFTLPPWTSIMCLPDATAANTPMTPCSESEQPCAAATAPPQPTWESSVAIK